MKIQLISRISPAHWVIWFNISVFSYYIMYQQVSALGAGTVLVVFVAFGIVCEYFAQEKISELESEKQSLVKEVAFFYRVFHRSRDLRATAFLLNNLLNLRNWTDWDSKIISEIRTCLKSSESFVITEENILRSYLAQERIKTGAAPNWGTSEAHALIKSMLDELKDMGLVGSYQQRYLSLGDDFSQFHIDTWSIWKVCLNDRGKGAVLDMYNDIFSSVCDVGEVPFPGYSELDMSIARRAVAAWDTQDIPS